MSASNTGRKAYCIITDKYGQKVKTNTVTISIPAKPKITTQPKSVTALKGDVARVSVKATGEGLTYTWYVRDNKTSTYKMVVSDSNTGRKVYCIITDKYGQTVKTNTVTLKKK